MWGDLLHLWLLSSVLAEENGVKLVQILAEWPLTTHIFALCFAFYCDKMKIIMLTSWTWPGKLHWIKQAGAQVWLCPGHSCLWAQTQAAIWETCQGFSSGKLSQPLFVFLRVCLTVSLADSYRKGFRQDWNASDSVLYPGVKFSVVLMRKRGCRNIGPHMTRKPRWLKPAEHGWEQETKGLTLQLFWGLCRTPGIENVGRGGKNTEKS